MLKEIRGKMRKTGAGWDEVCFVLNAIARSKNDPAYRYLAIREPLEQPELPGMEGHVTLPSTSAALWQESRSPLHHERRFGGREAAFLGFWGKRRLVVDYDSRLQCELGHEATGASGILGYAEDEGDPVLPYWTAWTGHEPCARLIGRLVKNHPSLAVLVKARQRIMEFDYAPSGSGADDLLKKPQKDTAWHQAIRSTFPKIGYEEGFRQDLDDRTRRGSVLITPSP